jgi:hypothetical protein
VAALEPDQPAGALELGDQLVGLTGSADAGRELVALRRARSARRAVVIVARDQKLDLLGRTEEANHVDDKSVDDYEPCPASTFAVAAASSSGSGGRLLRSRARRRAAACAERCRPRTRRSAIEVSAGRDRAWRFSMAKRSRIASWPIARCVLDQAVIPTSLTTSPSKGRGRLVLRVYRYRVRGDAIQGSVAGTTRLRTEISFPTGSHRPREEARRRETVRV